MHIIAGPIAFDGDSHVNRNGLRNYRRVEFARERRSTTHAEMSPSEISFANLLEFPAGGDPSKRASARESNRRDLEDESPH